MILLMLLMALVVLISVITFLFGLFKVIFQKDDKEFGIKLLIYSTIAFIVGFGTCAVAINGGI